MNDVSALFLALSKVAVCVFTALSIFFRFNDAVSSAEAQSVAL